MMNYHSFWWRIFAMLVVSTLAAQAQIKMRVGPHAMEDPESGPVIKVDIQFLVGPNERIGVIAESSPFQTRASYEIRKADSTEEPIKVTEVESLVKGHGVSTLHLTLAKPLEGGDYTVKLNGRWQILTRDGKPLGEYKNPEVLPRIKGSSTKIETTYLKQYAFKSHAEIARADKGTALDVHLFAVGNERAFAGFDHVHWEAAIKGQIGLDTKVREIYTDSWTASFSTNARSRIGELSNPWRVPIYFALNTELQGDRNFENITGATGVSLKMETAKLFSPIYKVFAEYNPLIIETDEPEVAMLAPYWELGYQFATKLQDDGMGKDYGENRFVGKFTWELPIMRHVGPASFKVNADLSIALAGIYHADTGDFTDESKVSLIFRQDDKSSKPLTFTVSYERGKTTPKFENYDAVLVGFRKLF